MWERICSKLASNLSALRPKDPHGFVLYKRREQFLRLAPTLKKDAPHLISLSCSSGTLLPSTKAWVVRILLWCGSKSQKLLTSLAKNKFVRVLWPQSEQIACGLGTNPPPQKGAFKGSAYRIKVLSALNGSFWDLFWPHRFVTLKGMPLPLLHMCSSGILLPSAKAYKAWVGHIFLRCGSMSQKLLTSLAKNKAVRVLQPQSGQTACRLGTNPPPQLLFNALMRMQEL